MAALQKFNVRKQYIVIFATTMCKHYVWILLVLVFARGNK